MKTKIHLLKLLAAATVLGVAASARALTIVPTFDSSITGDPNAAAMEAAINASIQIFESTYTDNVTVQITYVNDPSVDLGENETYYTSVTYSSFLKALKKKAADTFDTNALSKLPSGTVDPVIGGTMVAITTPLCRCLGLGNVSGPGGLDSTISINTTIVNFTRPGTNPDNYDMEEVLEHETDEVLGTSSALPNTAGPINAMDLFRYDTNLNRTFTTSGDNAYFSVDGTNLWARYNQDSDGDYGDFWSLTGYWAPPGKIAGPQVQDAFGTSGQYEDIGVNEKSMLDVVGWTLVPPVIPTNPVISIAHNGAGHIKISWSTNSSQFSLQESTNLNSSSAWVASASGSTNPAVILSSSVKKFYRLVYQPPAPDIALEQTAAMPASTNATVQLQTHIFHPYRY
jgi:hypothetical protein